MFDYDERVVTGEKPYRSSLRKFRVAVYNNHSGSRFHTNRPLAYLRYFSSDACIHEVTAHSGIEAKRTAIQEHLYNGDHMCPQHDAHCLNCPGVGARL